MGELELSPPFPIAPQEYVQVRLAPSTVTTSVRTGTSWFVPVRHEDRSEATDTPRLPT